MHPENPTIEVFNYPWHIAHQYSLVQVPDTHWNWLIQHRREYSSFPRGNYFDEYDINWVPHYEKGKYDVALLHLDQQCFEEGIRHRGKGSLFFQVKCVIKDIPKIVIMHGTPYYPESFPCDITKENYKQRGYTKDQVGMSSKLIDDFQKAVANVDAVIFNSYKAQKQWAGNINTEDTKTIYKTIWHGLNPDNWWDRPKEPRVVTMISPGGLDAYYDRVFLRGVKEVLAERDIHHCHITVDAKFKTWDEYREFLGRSLIYFNPTKESPMPRSRTEAMLSGCCVVTTPHQDADQFIENDENGFIIPRKPNLVADLIEGLLYDYKKAVDIGQKGKETAVELFHQERFNKEWRELLRELTGK